MAEAPGSDIGPYRIVAPIGSGGFATVYRARDHRLDAEVALKVLAENHSLNPDIRERFLAEARLLRRIDSRHIVGILDIGETDRLQPYLVLEFAERGDLHRRVEEARGAGRTISTDDVHRVAHDLADALRAVHAEDVVHRDVSPNNLLIKVTSPSEDAPGLLGPDERLVLTDLGFAKDLAAHSGLTMGGGTAWFCAPEQRNGADRVDRRADVYAASAVIAWLSAEATIGDLPKTGVARHLRRVGVEARLAEVLGRGLSHRPIGRHDDIDRWLTAVTEALEPATPAGDAAARPNDGGEGTGDERSGGDRSGVGRSLGPPRRRLVAALLALGLLVGAALGAGATWWQTRPDGPVETTLADGRVRVSDERGTLAGAVFGPARLTVGEPATFEAGASGGTSVAWVDPAGDVVAGEDRLVITPTSAGSLTVGLIVGGDGVPPLLIERTVTVTEPGD